MVSNIQRFFLPLLQQEVTSLLTKGVHSGAKAKFIGSLAMGGIRKLPKKFSNNLKVFTPDLLWIPTNDDGLEKVAFVKYGYFSGIYVNFLAIIRRIPQDWYIYPLVYHENQPNVGKCTTHTHASYKVRKFVRN